MNEELITICAKRVLGAFLFNTHLLAWDSYECHMTGSVIIPGGCTKYIRVPDVCWNKPFKARMSKLYDQWLREGFYQFAEGGNMKPLSTKRRIEWGRDAQSQLSKENIIKSFTCCGLNLANDGTEDDFIHCLKKGQPCKAGRQKLDSQLSILVDESDVVNPFISLSDERDPNKEMNVIEDKEIIMKINGFLNRLSCAKGKSYINNTSNL